jgi:esterase/lipase superfamily enzyme
MDFNNIKWPKIKYLDFLDKCLCLLRIAVEYIDNPKEDVIEGIALIIDEMETQCQYSSDDRIRDVAYGFADFVFYCIEREDKFALEVRIASFEEVLVVSKQGESEDEDEFFIKYKYEDLFVSQGRYDAEKKYKEIEIYYITDREEHCSVDNFVEYGDGRANNVYYGRSFVRVPVVSRIGEIVDVNHLGDDNGFLSIKNLGKLSAVEFYDVIRNSEDVLIYVHGYKTSFYKAVMVMAKMCDDLQYKGVPIIYSWPSCNKLLSYIADKENLVWSTENMKKVFCELIGCLNENAKIHMIAHSMGAAGMVDVIIGLAESNPANRKRINEFVLAAPDIDVDIFKKKIMRLNELDKDCLPITIYVSRNDWILRFAYNLLYKYRRVGDISSGVVVLKNVETVDASHVDNSVVGHGHSSFHKSKNMLIDIHFLLRGYRASQRFPLKEVSATNGVYWQILQ